MRRPLRYARHPSAEVVVTLLVLFLVLFPKGGLKLGDVPITWGYILIAVTSPILFFYALLFLPWRIRPSVVLALLSLLPFQILYVYSYLANGVALAGYAFSVAVSFFVLPFTFLLIYPPFFTRISRQRFCRLFCNCVTIAALWGLLLFFVWPFTHRLIEIPPLTVNLADYGTITQTKHIYRGPFLKLISTYNNGNVYGVATFLILPLYTLLERRRWCRNLVRVALFLTLARTVWIGLVAEQLLSLAQPFFLSLGSFPRLRLAGTGRRLTIVLVFLLVCVGYALTTPYAVAFILDPTLGGRLGELALATQSSWLPAVPLTGFSEVLFASTIVNYGFIGFLALSLVFFFPFVLALFRPGTLRDPVRRMALKGIALYLILAISDGAANLIPVLAFFWFVYSVFLFGLPGRPEPSPVAIPQARPTPPSVVGWSTTAGALPGPSPG